MATEPTEAVLPPVPISRATLAAARGRRKLDLILSSADPRQFVRRLPAEDLYFAIREIGMEDATEIVALASPNQFRAFLDLDAWDRDQPDIERALQWLSLAHDRRNPGAFRAKRSALDPEVMLLILKSFTIVHSLEENDDPVITSSNFLRTAENKYIIEIIPDGDTGAMVRRLLEDYIDESPFIATRLFESTRWEHTAELEETANRWRTGRMRDMGFPELEEALHIWQPLPTNWRPPASTAKVGPIAGVPALLLIASRHELFLDRVAAKLPDEDRSQFNEGLLYLLNCAIVADGIEPRALDLARDTLAAARDMLSLGLEILSAGDEEVAVQLLASASATDLFRYAVGQLSVLARRAIEAAKPLSFGAANGTVLDSPDAELITGLRRKRPRLYEAPGWRAFRSPEDLTFVEAAIRRVQAAAIAIARAGFDHEAIERVAEASGRAVTAVSVSQLLLTSALNGSAAPLAPDRVRELCMLFDAGKLKPEARAEIDRWFEGIRGGMPTELYLAFAEIAAFAIHRLEDEIGPPCAAGAGGLDPKFVECVLIQQSH